MRHLFRFESVMHLGFAVIRIDLSSLSLLQGIDLSRAPGHMEGDIWIEPERRYHLAALREHLCLPTWWNIPVLPSPVVWLDHWRHCFCLLLESESFPSIPEGTCLPEIRPMFRHTCDVASGKITTTFDHLDMREVQEAADAHSQAIDPQRADSVSQESSMLQNIIRAMAWEPPNDGVASFDGILKVVEESGNLPPTYPYNPFMTDHDNDPFVRSLFSMPQRDWP